MAFVLWITGLPGSGKSTVADGLKDLFPGSIVLRMDEIRRTVTPSPTYSDEERDLLYRALVYLAKVLFEQGHTIIIDATAHKRKWRELARREIEHFIEVYLRCPVEVCKEREMKRTNTHQAPRNIYRKADQGWPVPGIKVPFEESQEPEISIDADTMPINGIVKHIGMEIKKLLL